MKEKETIYKEAIKNKLENQLTNIGYVKDEEWKGLIKYKCLNNYLKFFHEWNRGQGFDCVMGFEPNEDWDYEYSFQRIILKLENIEPVRESIFGREFTERIEEWINEISTQVENHQIQKITKDNSIIKQLRNEYVERDKVYNTELQIYQTKKEADEAWQLKDFKSFIRILKNKTVELPLSYKKKLSIAEKKLKRENGA